MMHNGFNAARCHLVMHMLLVSSMCKVLRFILVWGISWLLAIVKEQNPVGDMPASVTICSCTWSNYG